MKSGSCPQLLSLQVGRYRHSKVRTVADRGRDFHKTQVLLEEGQMRKGFSSTELVVVMSVVAVSAGMLTVAGGSAC